MSHDIRQLMETEIEASLDNQGLFKDETILFSDYIPEILPHRENQILEMTKYMKGLFSRQQEKLSFRQTIIISGPVGSGKTSTAKKFGIDLQSYATMKLSNVKFVYRHLNCRRIRTIYLLLIELLKSFLPYYPERGFSSAELLRDLFQTLEKFNYYLLLTLDEIDYLLHDSELDTLLYALTRPMDAAIEPENQRLSLILITRNDNFLFLLESTTKSSLSKNIVKFFPYTAEQLESILQERIKKSLFPDVIQPALVSSIVAAAIENGGDARVAIELLWRSVKIAENEHSTSVQPEHVRLAKSYLIPISKEVLQDLPLQQKLVLLSIGRLFRLNPEKNKVTLTEIKHRYRTECTHFKVVVGQGHTSLWSYIQKLNDLGLIATRVTNTATKGRVTEISTEIPVNILVDEIEAQIKLDLQDR